MLDQTGRTSANEEGDDASCVGQANQSLMDGLTEQLDTRIATNAVDLVSCFGDYLALDQATMVCVRDVAEQVRNVGLLAGRSPVTVAAACIFMTTTLIGEDVTPSAIGNAAGVSVFTVSTSFRHLVESADQILTVSSCILRTRSHSSRRPMFTVYSAAKAPSGQRS